MSEKLSADLNIIQSAPIELELLDGDLNIIQKLDDEPNDVGGLTSAELKAKFDESGIIIKKYINETLIPAVLAEDATEESRKQAEAARVAAEQVRQSNEAARQNAEAQRVSAENARNVWEDYSASKAYAVGNKVASAGSSYLCIKPCTGIAPPNAEYWRLIAAKGAKGDTGAQGAQGPQGPQGAIGPEGPVGGSSNFVRYDAAQTLTDEQKMQARNNISAMQGIESTDHPGCNYVLNGSTVEWINPPMNGDEYTAHRMINRYKAQPIYKGILGDFEVWKPDTAVWPHSTTWGSAGKALHYTVEAGETKNIALTFNSTFLISWTDNVRSGLVVVQTTASNVSAITNVVPPYNWKIEIGTGLSVNVTELDGKWSGYLSVFMV